MFRHLHGSQARKIKWGSNLLLALLFCFTTPLFSQNLTVNLTAQEPSCNGFTNGVVTANPSGGNGNYSYQWNTGADGQQVVGGAGTYAVTVTDGNGATGTASLELAQPSAVMATISNTGSVCTNPGDIAVNASGGTGGYTYSWSNGSTDATQNGLAPGNYFVTVTDATGCATTASTTVFGLLDVSLNIINVTCFNGCDASIEAIINGGTAPYSFQWSNGVTTQVNPDLLPGTYSVTVTDGNGCQVVETATVSNGVTINVGVSTTDASCGDGADGSATFTATGGAAPYTFVVGGGFDADNLAPGTYTVTATDAQGCQGSTTFTIGGGSNLTVTVTNDYQCGDATGSATATVAGGSGNYTYGWSTGATTATITGLAPNATYSVTVTDNVSGCTGTGSTFITGIENITVNIASMMPSCNGFMNGAATATAMGGDGNYVYNWSNGADTRTIDNLGAGTYSVTVSDAQGCGGMASVTIGEPDVLGVTFSSNNATCDAPMSGSATAQPTGGTGPYSYEWTTGSTNATVSGLGAGTYGVTVTDVNGCTVNDMIAITAPASDLSVNVMGTDLTCNGDASGSATAQPMNGSGNYTYAWSNGATTATISGVAAGTYSVTVSDGDCTASGSVTINEPTALSATLAAVDGACTTGGSVTATVTGGTAPYAYAWSNGAATAAINDVAAGDYSVTVTDANGCTTTAGPVTVNAPDNNLTINVVGSNITCNGDNDGGATAQVANGSGNYTYAWSNGATTATISGLAAGTYTVTVADGDCTATGSVTVTEPSAVGVTATVAGDGGCSSSTGTVTATATGGTAPYTYTYSNGATGNPVDLAGGTYTLTATDANGCTATTTVTIASGGGINVTVNTTNTNCLESKVGTATAVVNGGTAPYTYMWSNGETTETITQLNAGIYRVTVTDANGCQASGVGGVNNTVFVEAEITSVTNTNCAGDATGAATVTASGGTEPYSYFWNNLATTPTITGLTPGTYDVVVTDANGCIDTTFAVIRAESDLTVDALIWNPECGDNSNGKVMAMAEGGTEPYTYLWSTGDVTQAILNLSAGTYCVTVTDGEGCTASDCADLESAPIPDVDIAILNPVSLGASDGSLQALPSNGTAPYAFNWSNGGNTPVISGLPSGRYGVTVTDNNFCQGEGEIFLPGPGNISGNVFNDLNRNGVRNFDEGGMGNIRVRLLGENIAGFSVDRSVTTNAAGNYSFDGVSSGTYRVRFSDLPNNFVFSRPGGSPNPSLNSSVTNPSVGDTDNFSFDSASFTDNVNAGIYLGGGRLMEDVNISVDVVNTSNVEVSWEVPVLVSNFAFVVERSDDGGETFQVIGDDAVVIEKDAMMIYRFTDESPKRGRAYYRVGYVMDTELEYSNTEMTMMSMPEFAMVYPNPVTDEVMVELFSALSTDARVQLMDTNGRIIKSKKLVSGDMHERMTLENLNPGIYFIRVLRQNDAEPTLIRVVKK